MSVARITEISATSPQSFEAAIRDEIARATAPLRHVEGAWIKEQRLILEEGQIKGYRVNMLITFVLDDIEPGGQPQL
jgi:flavin-binding protein dodecin